MSEPKDPNKVMRSLYVTFSVWQKAKELLLKTYTQDTKLPSLSALVEELLVDWISRREKK